MPESKLRSLDQDAWLSEISWHQCRNHSTLLILKTLKRLKTIETQHAFGSGIGTPYYAAHLSYFPPRKPFNACRCFTSASFLCLSINTTSLQCHMPELYVLPNDSLPGACPGCHAARTLSHFNAP